MKFKCACGCEVDDDGDIPIEHNRCPNCDNNYFDSKLEKEYNEVCERNQKNRRRIAQLESAIRNIIEISMISTAWKVELKKTLEEK